MRLIDADLESCDVLARLVGDAEPWTPPAPRRLAGQEVLVVDDDAQREFAVGQALQQAGARVRFVGLPRRAGLQAGIAQQSGVPYHLVVLNLDLPDIKTGGTAMIRRHGFTGPILGLTAAPARVRRAMGVGLGCAAVVGLPVDHEDLVEWAARAIDRHEADRMAGELAGDSDIEPEIVASTLAGYPHLTAMLEKFVQRLPGQVDQLVAAVDAQDRAALADLSEQIKQASVKHGFEGFARKASQLHHHVDEDRTLDALAEEARELAELCRKLTLRPLPSSATLPPRA